MPYVYSTLTADQQYTLYPKDLDFKKIPKPERTFFIAGGANVINKNLITPRGAATLVSADDLKVLETIQAFRDHKKDGFITVDTAKADADLVAKNMTARDKSAQLEEKDFKAEKKPKVNANG